MSTKRVLSLGLIWSPLQQFSALFADGWKTARGAEAFMWFVVLFGFFPLQARLGIITPGWIRPVWAFTLLSQKEQRMQQRSEVLLLCIKPHFCYHPENPLEIWKQKPVLAVAERPLKGREPPSLTGKSWWRQSAAWEFAFKREENEGFGQRITDRCCEFIKNGL